MHEIRAPGDGRLVHQGLAVHDLAVHADFFIGVQHHHVAGNEVGHLALHLHPVHQNKGVVGGDAQNFADGAAGALRDPGLDQLCAGIDPQDLEGREGLARGHGGHATRAQEHFQGEALFPDLAHGLAEQGQGRGHGDQTQGTQGGFRHREPQDGLADHHHAQHRADAKEPAQGRTNGVASRTGGGAGRPLAQGRGAGRRGARSLAVSAHKALDAGQNALLVVPAGMVADHHTGATHVGPDMLDEIEPGQGSVQHRDIIGVAPQGPEMDSDPAGNGVPDGHLLHRVRLGFLVVKNKKFRFNFR